MPDPTIVSDIAAGLAVNVSALLAAEMQRLRDATRTASSTSSAMARANAIEISDQVGHAAASARSLTVALRLALSAPSDFGTEECSALRSLAGLLRQELDDAADNIGTLMTVLDGLHEGIAA